PIKYVPANMGALFLPGGETVRLVVKDERAEDSVIAGGFSHVGGYGDKYGFALSERPDTVSNFFDSALKEGIEILGLRAGDGPVLELTIKDFRIGFFVTSAMYTPPNYVAYGLIETALKSPDGTPLESQKLRVAVFLSGTGGDDPAGYIYCRAAWEAASRALLAEYPLRPDPDAIAKLLKALDVKGDDYRRARAVFWLGLAGKGNPAVAEKLFSLFRSEKDQTVRESAAVALAMLASPGAREEFEAVLAGGKKLAEWDVTDLEETWHLLHCLAVLGATDLKTKVPANHKGRSKLLELVRFHEAGEIPAPSPEEAKKLVEARKKLKK
ncbi:MAG: HEAT repeat domain-containing protein, partial [Thermoanaerobaculia bacterium]